MLNHVKTACAVSTLFLAAACFIRSGSVDVGTQKKRVAKKLKKIYGLPMLTVVFLLVLPGTGTAQQGGSFVEVFTSTLYKDELNTTARWDTLTGELKLFPYELTLAGSYVTPTRAFGVAVSGDYAYVSASETGLQVIDISDPATPALTGGYDTPSVARWVAVSGDYAYVADWESGLQVIDISDPALPTLAASYDTPSIAWCVAVAGDYAYVADAYSGLQVIDISDPTAPAPAGSRDTPAYARNVVISGDYAYVADDWGGLQVIDISDPTNPDSVGSYDTPANARCVAISGDYAYVADWTSGLQVIDISDPTAPAFVASYNPPGDDFGVAISGDYAYVASQASGLHVLDVSDPSAPAYVGSYDTPGDAYSVVVSGDYAYVGDYGSGFQVIKIADPVLPPRLAATQDTPGGAYDVAVAGDYAYVADYGRGLQVIDISNPIIPAVVGDYNTPGYSWGVAIEGDYAYVADYDSGFHVIDISDPTTPTIAGGVSTPGDAMDVVIAGDYACVVDGWAGLRAYDISDPTTPTFAGVYDTPGSAFRLAVEGDFAYVADRTGGLQVIDISDPTTPALAGTYATPGSASWITISGDYAYVADWEAGLHVVDISDPTTPVRVGSYQVSYDVLNPARFVAIAGDYAYVGKGNAELQVLDITDPTTPTFVDSYDVPGGYYGAVVSGDYLYVADSGGGLQVLQVFQRDVNVANNVGQSLTIDSAVNDIVSVRLTTTQTDSIGWLISANGGSNWEPVTPDAGWHDLVYTGSDLRWRSDHEQLSPQVNPACDTLFVEWMEILADDDGDGVPNVTDLCPAEDASFFDHDGDGCIDEATGARHVAYWAPENMPVTYFIHEDGAPGISDGSDFTAIQNAMNAWADVPAAEFTVNYAGDTTLADGLPLDGVNLVTFADASYDFPPGLVSVALTTSFTEPTIYNGHLYRPGEIVEVDVLFNPVLSYRTPSQGTGYDVQAGMAHSAGHVAGISHSIIQSSTMYMVYNDIWNTLAPDDELTLIKAYPTPSVLSDSTRLSGTVTYPNGVTPLPGAAVFAIDAVSGDTLVCDYTLPDGSYEFYSLPVGEYYIGTHPLDGSAPIGYVTPSHINTLVNATAETQFIPEFYDAAESNVDNPAEAQAVSVDYLVFPVVDIVTNLDQTPPTVVSVVPADGETGVLTTSAIVVEFSEPMDIFSISGNFSVVDTFTSTSVSGTVGLVNNDSVLLLTPFSPLTAQTVYEITVETGMMDQSGNNLAARFVSHFTTELLPDGDGDGVPDVADLCPAEDASYFDRNGDGCIDPWISARQTSYWDPGDMPFEYWIHEDGAYGITDLSDFAAVENGVSSWAALPGVDVSVNYLGATTQRDARFLDGINLVTFDDPDLLFLSDVIAVGLTTTFTEPTVFDGEVVRPGQIVDADMIFNKQKTFSTTSMGTGPDIESVTAHEAGHWFGFFHSAITTSTMFYILPPGGEGASLSLEDSTMFFRGYPDPLEVAGANILTGTVRDSVTGEPVPGAIVYAINISSGDTLGCDYTLPSEILPAPGMPQEGSFCFSGLPDGDYYVAIYPLNGTSPIKFLEAYNVSFLLDTTAVDNFVPEYWDIDESASDDRTARTPITVVGGDSVHVELILNVDTTRPTVTSITPQNLEGNVRSDAAVLITFSEPIDVSSITTSTFSLAPALGGPSVGGLASFPKVKDDSLLAFTPFAALDFGITYRLTLETGITDKFGNGLAAPFVSEFTIEDQPPVSISSLMPSKGIIGSVVTISGLGFSSVAEEDTVLFSGVQAAISDAQPNQLIVTVPPGIPTGALVSVKVGADESTQLTFTVLPTTEVARGIETGVFALGSTPRSLTTTPDGNNSYVATDAGVTNIVVQPGPTFLDDETVSIAGGVDELDVNPQGNRIFAVGRSDSALHVLDVSNPLSTLVLETLPVGAGPLGIIVDHRGDRAYVTTDASEIQIWDVSRRRLPTQAHAEQIGTIASSDPNLRKKMAIDPVRNHLLTLSGLGKVLVFDLNGDSLLTDVSVGTDPQDIVVDPFANRAYVSDANGKVTAVRLDLDPPSYDGEIFTGGSPRGITITPAGRFVYTTNRDLDLMQAIDLFVNSTAFRTVAATVPHRSRPVDIDLSPGGTYAHSIAEGQNQFVVTTIGLGPTLKSLSRIAGPLGTQLVLSGDGFGTDALQTSVSFNGVAAVPSEIRETALTVTVPPGAVSGDVIVERSTPSGTTVSNALPFEVLGSSSGALRLAAQLAPPGGPVLEQVMATSPKGDLLIVAERGPQPDLDGRLHILDAASGSATFNQFMDVGAVVPFDTSVADVAISPDGKKAFVVLTRRDTIPVVDVDRYSSTFGKQVDVVTTGSYVVPPTRFVVSPDGQIGLAMRGSLANIIDLVEESPTRYQAVDSFSSISTFYDGAFHPSGIAAYLTGGDGTFPEVNVVDLDSTSVNFGNIIATLPFPGIEWPRSISFAPDGDRCLALILGPSPLPRDRMVFTIDSSDPVSPVFVDDQTFGTGSLAVQEVIDISPRGDRAVFHIEGAGFEHIDLTTTPYPTVETAYGSLNLTYWDIDYAPNASKFFGVSADNDSVYVFDFNDVQTMAIESGNLQTGVVNQPLALPLRVEVTDAGSNPIREIPVTFAVQTGGGVLTGTNAAMQTVATDANGFAEVTLQLGSTAGNATNLVLAWAVGLLGSPVTFTANAILDPLTQPLRFLTITPSDGASNVDILTAIQMTFSRGVDQTSATSSTFFLHKNGEPSTPVASIIGFTDLNRKLSLSPLDPLDANTTYVVKATTGLRDESGAALDVAVAKEFTTEPPPPLKLASVAPPAAIVSTTVILAGTGFDQVLENNTVLFEDEAAELLDGSTDFLKAVVPLGATTDSVRVTTPAGTSNALPFDVLAATTSSVDEVVDGINTPSATRGIAINPAGTWAYAISTTPPVVIPIDIAAQTSYPGIPVGANPVAIDIHPNGKYAYVANFGSNSVTVININPADTQHFNTPDTTVIVGTGPIDLVASPLGDRVYVANLGSSDISVMDVEEGSATFNFVVDNSGVNKGARAVAMNPTGTRLYVGTDDGYVVLDPQQGLQVVSGTDKKQASKQVVMGPTGTRLYVLTTEGDLVVYNIEPGSPNENEVTDSTTGRGGKTIAMNPAGTLLYLTLLNDQVLVFSVETPSNVSVIEDTGTEGISGLTLIKEFSLGSDLGPIVFDPTGSGLALVSSVGEGLVLILNTSDVSVGALETAIEVTPRTLNLKSRGRWVTGGIELTPSPPFFAQDIDINTILLNGAVPAEPGKWVIEDENQNGIDELVVVFDRALVQSVLPQGDSVEVTITGTVGTRTFSGSDIIRTIRPKVTFPKGGEILRAGSVVNVTWTSPEGYHPDAADIYWTPNDGVDWYPIAEGITDAGAVEWVTPPLPNDSCRVEVTLFEGGSDLGIGMSQEMFTIGTPLAVTLTGFTGAIKHGTPVVQWTTGLELNIDGFHLLRAERDAGVYERVTSEVIPSRGQPSGADYGFIDETARPNQDYFYKLRQVSESGESREFGPYKVVFRASFSLEQNFPNPFNPSTAIRFTIPKDSHVNLTVYDVTGRRVRNLVNEKKRANFYKIEWDGTNSTGDRVASGVYFYRLVAGKFSETKKMIMLK